MRSSLDLVRIASSAAEQAARYLRSIERPRSPELWTAKGKSDFVSEADRTSEAIITESLLSAIPGSTVVGEEHAPDLRTEGLVWIVDPIDGTTNFLHGFPAYSISIGATLDGALEAGVVLHIETGQLYHARRDSGAWLGDQRLQVSTIADPAHALIGTGFPFKNPEQLLTYQRQFGHIMRATSGIRRAGSAALDLAWTAAGIFDGFWELILAPWDVAAGFLLVREAGGVVTDPDGFEIGPGHGAVVAGNPAIHKWLVEVLQSLRQPNPLELR